MFYGQLRKVGNSYVVTIANGRGSLSDIELAQHLETIASEREQRQAAIADFEQWLAQHLTPV